MPLVDEVLQQIPVVTKSILFLISLIALLIYFDFANGKSFDLNKH